MAEYIKQDDALRQVLLVETRENMFQRIKYLPAADVVKVVRCRDCMHYDMGVCLKIYDDGAASKDAWQERRPTDFCSYGEKREES